MKQQSAIREVAPARRPGATLDCPCEMAHFERRFVYTVPPVGEKQFPFTGDGAYRREVHRCRLCGHFVAVHDIDMAGLYRGDYVDATYDGDEGLRRAFSRIMALDPAVSDNVGRVDRIQSFAVAHFPGRSAADGTLGLLDVGAGLAVFPARMKAEGWQCTALDPDPRAARHAREHVGVDAVCGDFMALDAAALGRFDLVTFNKVLEHVAEPVAMLAKAGDLLADNGAVYVELPDGEAAAEAGAGRQEFFIDHHHMFSPVSIALLAERAGFWPLVVERLREPSGKFTLRMFVVPAPRAPTEKE